MEYTNREQKFMEAAKLIAEDLNLPFGDEYVFDIQDHLSYCIFTDDIPGYAVSNKLDYIQNFINENTDMTKSLELKYIHRMGHDHVFRHFIQVKLMDEYEEENRILASYANIHVSDFNAKYGHKN